MANDRMVYWNEVRASGTGISFTHLQIFSDPVRGAAGFGKPKLIFGGSMEGYEESPYDEKTFRKYFGKVSSQIASQDRYVSYPKTGS